MPDAIVTYPTSDPLVVTADSPVRIVLTYQGPAGRPGASGTGSAVSYPVTSVSSWNQAHTFPYDPDVRLVDAAGNACEIGVDYPNPTHVSITFPTPFTGTIILS